jgi:serine/threonine protein kinase
MSLLCRSQYNAEPADIWSCGIVLVAMLTGELPWDKPTSDQVISMLEQKQENVAKKSRIFRFFTKKVLSFVDDYKKNNNIFKSF